MRLQRRLLAGGTIIAGAVVGGHALPNGYAWGCLNISKSLPFCDHALPMEVRTQDLVSRLTLREKISLLGADTKNTNVGSCDCMDYGVERLGIPKYMNLVETNSAVASACLEENKCGTSFPGPTGLASSFNRTGWRAKGAVISDEMRAFNNLNWWRGVEAPYSLISLSGYGPNINIERDPRFGRNSELPGEDPYLSGMYALHYIKGMQEGDDQQYYKMIAGLKHFDAYSVDDGRAYRIFNISAFDLWDTYLRQFKYGFRPDLGNAGQAMCAYSGVNGVPCCAHDYLQNKVVREHWKRPDALIVSDCGATTNMVTHNFYASSPEDAAAKSLLGGMDVELGGHYFSLYEMGGNDTLVRAINMGMVDEARISESVSRVILNRMRVGLFDPLETQPYTYLGKEAVNTTASQALVMDLTLQSLVLLKNREDLLPLAPGTRIAVVGPHVNSTRDLMEDYAGDEFCIDGTTNCLPTIGDVFTRLNGGGNTRVARGVGFSGNDTSGVGDALAAVRASDVVVLVLGTSNTEEHEGIDRKDTRLPGLQEDFAHQVLAEGKPVVLVLINGGIVSIDSLIDPCHAIVEAFNPGQRGALGLYLSLFGQANRWGRLPVTIYPLDYTSQVDMYSFDMTTGPGRTYRYYQGKPLFEFGQGMSYSPFKLECQAAPSSLRSAFSPRQVHLQVRCTATNEGRMDADQVVMLFHVPGDDVASRVGNAHPLPRRTLVGFERVAVAAGQVGEVVFEVTTQDVLLTDEHGDRVVYRGSHELHAFDGVTWIKPAAVVRVASHHDKTVVEQVPRFE